MKSRMKVMIAVVAMFTASMANAQMKAEKNKELEIEMVSVQGNSTVSSFNIGKYEVTQGQWKAVMGDNPSRFKSGDNYPVENVSWNDVQDFLSRLNALTGKNYRLPRETEWEYAARGGNSSRGYKYSGSANINDVAWYDGNSGERTHPVGTKAPNELGIYDMSGNVKEWCQDAEGSYRVYRGGCWASSAATAVLRTVAASSPTSATTLLVFALFFHKCMN
jgi:formylglycine-generating enzyme required for sulfatase activity